MGEVATGGTDDMTEHERQLRRRDRMRIGAILALFLLGAVPVVVAFAASPDPSASDSASPAGTEAPSATTAPAAPVAPNATKAPSTQTDKTGKGVRGFGGFGSITITDINGSSLSLKTDDGWTRTITVTADTKITKAGQAMSLSDLAVGDHIRFSQKKND